MLQWSAFPAFPSDCIIPNVCNMYICGESNNQNPESRGMKLVILMHSNFIGQFWSIYEIGFIRDVFILNFCVDWKKSLIGEKKKKCC